MRLLEGDVVEDDRESRIVELEAEVEALRSELSQAKFAITQAQREATRALSALRRQLTPLYRALQGVFGELDAAGVEDAAQPGAPPANARVTAVWDNWKSKMGTAAKVIDALQLHGELNTQQLAVAVGLHRTTIPALIHKLNKAGLITKNGGRFALKQL